MNIPFFIKYLFSFIFFFTLAISLSNCSKKSVNNKDVKDLSISKNGLWDGVYSSPSDISGYGGTVLLIEGIGGALKYRKKGYSDVIVANSIKEEIENGDCLTENDYIYIPNALGYFDGKGKVKLTAIIYRYKKVIVNGHITLMDDEAYKAFKFENKFLENRILIKVSDLVKKHPDIYMFINFNEVEHKPIDFLKK